jgi:hypothetical protein
MDSEHGGRARFRFLARQVEVARAALDDPTARVGLVEYGIGPDVDDADLLDAVWRAHPSAGLEGGPVYDALVVAAEHMPAGNSRTNTATAGAPRPTYAYCPRINGRRPCTRRRYRPAR